MLDENRVNFKVLNDDVVIFRRHDRMYRLSNLANNWLPGKLFVLINANTPDRSSDIADRTNLLSARSRKRCATFFADYWQLENSKLVQEDLSIVLEILTELGSANSNPIRPKRLANSANRGATRQRSWREFNDKPWGWRFKTSPIRAPFEPQPLV